MPSSPTNLKPAPGGVPTYDNINDYVPVVMLDTNNPEEVISIVGANVINTMLYIAGALTIIYLFVAGGQFITAAGDSSKMEAAKRKLLNAVLGIVVITLTLFIVRMIIAAITVNTTP